MWYIGGKKRKRRTQKRKRFPIGLIASAAAPLIGEIAKLIFKKIFGRGRKRR